MASETSLNTLVPPIVKAKECRDQATVLFEQQNYRQAMMLFHRCILLARGVYQDCSVAMHHNSSVEMSQTAQTSLADVTVSDKVEETKAEVEGQLKETSRLIAECYLGLAKCVLNGQGRTQQDYRRAAQYCDNVLEFETGNVDVLLIKALAFMRSECFKEALEILILLPEGAEVAALIDECHQSLNIKRQKRDEQIQANFAKQQNNERNNGPDRNGHALNGSALH